MYWEEEKESVATYQVPEKIIDVAFKIKCKTLPLDHADSLSGQIIKHLPWAKDEHGFAIHQIHVAESANGWFRPEDPENEILNVSHRTKMTLRVPSSKLILLDELVGKTLDIDGHPLTVGQYSKKVLSKMTTIFARYVDTEGQEDEADFIEMVYQNLTERDIKVRKMLSGKLTKHQISGETVLTRKIMLSDLERDESIVLQEEGIGDKQRYGIGIFLPHKGIDAVKESQEQ